MARGSKSVTVTENQILAALPKAVREKFQALNERQRRFVIAYCTEAPGNATAAAKLAGYAGGRNAAVQGSWLLTFPVIREAIDAYMTAFAMSSAELVARVADYARAHAGPFLEVQDGGTVVYKVTKENWERYQHWVKGVEFDPKGRVTKLILVDPQRAQDQLSKILKLTSDAPQINLLVYLSKLSDAELLQQLHEVQTTGRVLPNPAPEEGAA